MNLLADYVKTLLWDPVNVPQTTGGLIPAGLVTVTVSRDVHVPAGDEGCLNTAESKSNLNKVFSTFEKS